MILSLLKWVVPLAFLALTACGTPQQAVQTEEQKEMQKIAKEVSKAKEEAAAKGDATPAVTAAIPPETDPNVREEPEPEIPKVSVLMGKTISEIKAVFGDPALRRKDKPAEVWQYLTSECALHLIFYPETDKKTGKLTVQHIAMNDRKKAYLSDARACFGSQLKKVGEHAEILS
ncbi:hypothetical protein [Sneathiella sp.]|jgi:hypothetical protein|uniref:hypothetical protein n=1 Tax=Sneathiella sp. TaxID=1964365 RepID=UPI0039E266D2